MVMLNLMSQNQWEEYCVLSNLLSYWKKTRMENWTNPLKGGYKLQTEDLLQQMLAGQGLE